MQRCDVCKEIAVFEVTFTDDDETFLLCQTCVNDLVLLVNCPDVFIVSVGVGKTRPEPVC